MRERKRKIEGNRDKEVKEKGEDEGREEGRKEKMNESINQSMLVNLLEACPIALS